MVSNTCFSKINADVNDVMMTLADDQIIQVYLISSTCLLLTLLIPVEAVRTDLVFRKIFLNVCLVSGK